jgi:hypothetical protein
MNEKPAVFLDRDDIREWDKPLKKDYYRLHEYNELNGSTELIKSLGIENLDEEIDGFRVVANASKYIARVRPLDVSRYLLFFTDGVYTNKEMECVLFDGGIHIYNIGEIPGTELNGPNLERQGRIWTVEEPVSIYSVSDGLFKLIFGRKKTKKENMRKRIEAINLGYEQQEKARSDAELEAKSESYRRGKLDHHESMFGTFGHVPLYK